ncbi:MAG TPA: hypothetical protein VJP40_09030, partial [bacterium]|nr:hypothetical protein [bacterium]
AANTNDYYDRVEKTLKPTENIDAVLLELAPHFNDPAKIIVITCERPVDNADALRARIEAFDASARIEIHQPGNKGSIEVPGKARMDQIHHEAATDGTMLMWDGAGKNIRDLFEIQGTKGPIFLQNPNGVSRIEISADKPLSKEDIAYLLTRARDLREADHSKTATGESPPIFEIEVTVKGQGTFHFESSASGGLKIRSNNSATSEVLNTLIELSVHHGEKIEIKTPDGRLEIQNGDTVKDSKIFTKDAKAAAAAPENVTLQMDKTPSASELQALKDQGVKTILITEDPTLPGWFDSSIAAMNIVKGLNVRVVDSKGKVLWENSVKSTGDNLNTATDALAQGFAAQAKSGKPLLLDKASPEQLDILAGLAARGGENLTIKTATGTIEIQGKGNKEAKILTKDAKTAAQAPDRITLQLDKVPTDAELAALKTQGIQRVLFQDDPSAPAWIVNTLGTMKASKGLSVQAVDSKGQLLWENVSKNGVDTLNTPSEPFLQGLAAHAKASGWTDRLAETQKLLGPDGNFAFTADALRWAASHDLADASIPKGGTKPAVTAEQFDAWILSGTQLANAKLAKANEKGRTDLAAELKPFADGFNVDPSKPNGWSQATAKLKQFMSKGKTEAELAGKLFEALNREATTSSAFENNAYDLANHLQTSDNPYSGIKAVADLAGKSTGLLKIQGSYFGTCFKKSRDTGAQAEFDTLNDMITQAGPLTAQGNQVVIEAIPTSKALEGVTPDFAVTVSKGTSQARYVVEVKKAGPETVAGIANEAGFRSELEAGFKGTKSRDDKSTLGSLMGKGLYQLSTYKGKNPGDNLVLNVRLNAEAPDYVAKALKDFLAANCPGVVVKFQFQKMKAESVTTGRMTERSFETAEVTVRADGASKYAGYDTNPNFFAPSIPAASGK